MGRGADFQNRMDRGTSIAGNGLGNPNSEKVGTGAKADDSWKLEIRTLANNAAKLVFDMSLYDFGDVLVGLKAQLEGALGVERGKPT